MKRILLAGAALALALCPLAARAFPDHPPRIIGGFAPGGTSDIVARLVAEAIAPTFGQRPVVENRTGANGAIAAEAVARATPDGNTVLQCATGLLTISPQLLGAHLPIDPRRELVPIVNVAHSTQAMVVATASPYRDVAAFLAAARQRPGRLTYASAGIGTTQHLAGERLRRLAGIDMLHVAYRGAAPAARDVIAGRADLLITNLGDVVRQIQGGELRLLALGLNGAEAILPHPPPKQRRVQPNLACYRRGGRPLTTRSTIWLCSPPYRNAAWSSSLAEPSNTSSSKLVQNFSRIA
jgi:tripartite-type tricarboxylate transporter receptor subunit TctC